jgi:hypothetical protein
MRELKPPLTIDELHRTENFNFWHRCKHVSGAQGLRIVILAIILKEYHFFYNVDQQYKLYKEENWNWKSINSGVFTGIIFQTTNKPLLEQDKFSNVSTLGGWWRLPAYETTVSPECVTEQYSAERRKLCPEEEIVEPRSRDSFFRIF